MAVKDALAEKANGNGSEVAKPDNKPKTIFDYVQSMKSQLALALPKHMDAEKMVRIVTTEMRRNPKLAECTRDSLLGAIMLSAQVGLEPSPLGYAYLIPTYNGKTKTTDCRFEIGYKGFLRLVRNSAEVSTIYAESVCENDEFELTRGTENKIIHKPNLKDRGAPYGFYAMAQMKDGSFDFEFMNIKEIEKRKKVSQSKDSSYSPWNQWFEEMAKKTVLKALCKRLPLSPDLAQNLYVDGGVANKVNNPQHEDDNLDVQFIDVEYSEGNNDTIDTATGEIITNADNIEAAVDDNGKLNLK